MSAPSHSPRFITEGLHWIEVAVYAAIAVVIAAMSIETLIEAVHSLAAVNVAGAVTVHLVGVLNDLLFVIILLELMRTVTEHLKRGGFQLRPFLIIGIVSSVRRILVLGAQLSVLHGVASHANFLHDVIELGVETGVVLVLTVSLFIAARRRKRP